MPKYNCDCNSCKHRLHRESEALLNSLLENPAIEELLARIDYHASTSSVVDRVNQYSMKTEEGW